MLSHYLLTLYRSLSRHRLYAAINVLGLALGIAVFLVLMLMVRFETGFERWIPDAPQVYAVRTHTAAEGWFPYTMGDLLDELRADYPQIVGARVQVNSGVVRRNGTITSETVSDVDPSLFQVLDLPRIAGDPSQWLRTPDEVVITAAKAKQYFGTVSPMGQTLTLDHRGEVRNLRVVGVIKDPPQTTEFKFGLLVPLKIPKPQAYPRWRTWGAMDVETYLRLPTAAQADALNGQMDAFVDRHNIHAVHKPAHRSLSLGLTPLVAMRLIVPPAGAVVTAIAVVAVLTLLLAAVNYINLATARAALRAREVAVRKVLGATVPALIRQFIGEAVVTVALAALLGLALCELSLPLIDAMLGIGLKLDYVGDPWLLGTTATVVIALGLGAGVYPAFVLSRFQPAAVLASARSPGGGRAGARLREALVVFQFAVAIAFTVGAGVILSQAHYLRRMDLGFTRAGLIEVDSFPHDGVSAAQRASLLDAWRTLPGIVRVTQSDSTPGDSDTPISSVHRPGAIADSPPIHEADIGPDFFETYGAHLIAGRWPDRRHGADFPATPAPDASQQPALNVVVNLRALTLLGFKTPQEAIGKPLIEGRMQTPRFTIIGVVSDLRFASPREPLEPIVYLPAGGEIGGGQAVVRYADPDASAVMARLAATWRAIVPTQPFEAKTMLAELEPRYHADDQVSRLLTLAAALSVAISCIGLYGLAAFNTARRVREIGIRKTLGASTADILTLLIGQFLGPVLIANLAAWPLAYLAMRAYLAGFDQRIGLNPLYFVAATALTLLIAVATVGGQAYAVAAPNPPARSGANSSPLQRLRRQHAAEHPVLLGDQVEDDAGQVQQDQGVDGPLARGVEIAEQIGELVVLGHEVWRGDQVEQDRGVTLERRHDDAGDRHPQKGQIEQAVGGVGQGLVPAGDRGRIGWRLVDKAPDEAKRGHQQHDQPQRLVPVVHGAQARRVIFGVGHHPGQGQDRQHADAGDPVQQLVGGGIAGLHGDSSIYGRMSP